MEIWGCSSVGRAPALHAGGHRFEPVHLHQRGLKVEIWKFFNKTSRFERLAQRVSVRSLKTEYRVSKSKVPEEKPQQNECQFISMNKLIRADGGCLGAGWRRKTWLTAKSFGESLNRL